MRPLDIAIFVVVLTAVVLAAAPKRSFWNFQKIQKKFPS